MSEPAKKYQIDIYVLGIAEGGGDGEYDLTLFRSEEDATAVAAKWARGILQKREGVSELPDDDDELLEFFQKEIYAAADHYFIEGHTYPHH
jgi:hypothetical protein